MSGREIIDDLYMMAVKRYKEECPNIEFTDAFADRIWFSIKGVLDHEGEAAAKEYVETAELIKEVRP